MKLKLGKDNNKAGAIPTSVVPPSPAVAEKPGLQKLELTISKSLGNAFELASIFAEIREKKLYKPYYETFEEYCKNRWKYKHSYCTKLIALDSLMEDLMALDELEAPKNLNSLGTARGMGAVDWNLELGGKHSLKCMKSKAVATLTMVGPLKQIDAVATLLSLISDLEAWAEWERQKIGDRD